MTVNLKDESATELLREALRARNKVWNLTRMARDHGLAMTALDDFIANKKDLPVDAMQSLIKEIWHGHHALNPATDRLEPTFHEEIRPMTGKPVLDLKSLPRYQAGAAQRAHKLEREAIHKPDERPDAKNRSRVREA